MYSITTHYAFIYQIEALQKRSLYILTGMKCQMAKEWSLTVSVILKHASIHEQEKQDLTSLRDPRLKLGKSKPLHFKS